MGRHPTIAKELSQKSRHSRENGNLERARDGFGYSKGSSEIVTKELIGHPLEQAGYFDRAACGRRLQ